MINEQAEWGPQPLNDLLDKLDLKNDDLVKHSTEQLTYKQVQKARKGRAVTPNIKGKIQRALNACVVERQYSEKELFNY